ncbi:MAG: hypothetical protein CMP23_00145 [Rickettsiales bacterium]|nr:hypothetical protein [Rickettsiales bacterium]
MLWLLWLLPLLVTLFWIAARKRRQAMARFADEELMELLVLRGSGLRTALRPGLVVLALIGIVVAAAGPRWGFQWEEVHRRGVDVVIALDLSRSMLAEDAKPNRLTVAKREIRDLLELLQGDRIALVAFAGTAFVQCPLTLDYGAFEVFLDPMDPGWVPVGGTDLAAAVRTSIDAFPKNERSGRAVLLITDGEDHSGELQAAAEEAREQGVHLFVVGIGDPGGAPVPDGRGGFVKENGRVVLTRLDESSLKELALTTKGSYVRSSAGDLDLRKIYLEDIRGSLQARELSSSRQRRWEERFQLALLPAFLLLLLESLIGPPRRRERKNQRGKTGPTLLAITLIPGQLLLAQPAEASWLKGPGDPLQAGYEAFQDGDYQSALDRWVEAQIDSPGDYRIDYNIGQAHYRLGNYPEAEKAFQAAASSDTTSLSADASYNAGNAAFQQGRYKEAIGHYERCLELRESDEDAVSNRDLAQRRYEELLEQARNEQEQRDQQEQQDQQQDQDDGNAEQREPGQEAEPGEEGQQQNQQEQQQGQAGQEQQEQRDQQEQDESDGEAKQEQAPEPEQQGDPAGQAAAADIERSDQEEPSEAAQGAISEQTDEAEQQESAERAIIEGALSREQAEALLDALEADQQSRRKERTRREGQRGRKAARKDW